MSQKAKDFMNEVWKIRNDGADTEEKLVAGILKTAAERVTFYKSQNGMTVLDKSDLIKLSDEIENLTE